MDETYQEPNEQTDEYTDSRRVDSIPSQSPSSSTRRPVGRRGLVFGPSASGPGVRAALAFNDTGANWASEPGRAKPERVTQPQRLDSRSGGARSMQEWAKRAEQAGARLLAAESSEAASSRGRIAIQCASYIRRRDARAATGLPPRSGRLARAFASAAASVRGNVRLLIQIEGSAADAAASAGATAAPGPWGARGPPASWFASLAFASACARESSSVLDVLSVVGEREEHSDGGGLVTADGGVLEERGRKDSAYDLLVHAARCATRAAKALESIRPSVEEDLDALSRTELACVHMSRSESRWWTRDIALTDIERVAQLCASEEDPTWWTESFSGSGQAGPGSGALFRLAVAFSRACADEDSAESSFRRGPEQGAARTMWRRRLLGQSNPVVEEDRRRRRNTKEDNGLGDSAPSEDAKQPKKSVLGDSSPSEDAKQPKKSVLGDSSPSEVAKDAKQSSTTTTKKYSSSSTTTKKYSSKRQSPGAWGPRVPFLLHALRREVSALQVASQRAVRRGESRVATEASEIAAALADATRIVGSVAHTGEPSRGTDPSTVRVPSSRVLACDAEPIKAKERVPWRALVQTLRRAGGSKGWSGVATEANAEAHWALVAAPNVETLALDIFHKASGLQPQARGRTPSNFAHTSDLLHLLQQTSSTSPALHNSIDIATLTNLLQERLSIAQAATTALDNVHKRHLALAQEEQDFVEEEEEEKEDEENHQKVVDGDGELFEAEDDGEHRQSEDVPQEQKQEDEFVRGAPSPSSELAEEGLPRSDDGGEHEEETTEKEEQEVDFVEDGGSEKEGEEEDEGVEPLDAPLEEEEQKEKVEMEERREDLPWFCTPDIAMVGREEWLCFVARCLRNPRGLWGATAATVARCLAQCAAPCGGGGGWSERVFAAQELCEDSLEHPLVLARCSTWSGLHTHDIGLVREAREHWESWARNLAVYQFPDRPISSPSPAALTYAASNILTAVRTVESPFGPVPPSRETDPVVQTQRAIAEAHAMGSRRGATWEGIKAEALDAVRSFWVQSLSALGKKNQDQSRDEAIHTLGNAGCDPCDIWTRGWPVATLSYRSLCWAAADVVENISPFPVGQPTVSARRRSGVDELQISVQAGTTWIRLGGDSIDEVLTPRRGGPILHWPCFTTRDSPADIDVRASRRESRDRFLAHVESLSRPPDAPTTQKPSSSSSSSSLPALASSTALDLHTLPLHILADTVLALGDARGKPPSITLETLPIILSTGSSVGKTLASAIFKRLASQIALARTQDLEHAVKPRSPSLPRASPASSMPEPPQSKLSHVPLRSEPGRAPRETAHRGEEHGEVVVVDEELVQGKRDEESMYDEEVGRRGRVGERPGLSAEVWPSVTLGSAAGAEDEDAEGAAAEWSDWTAAIASAGSRVGGLPLRREVEVALEAVRGEPKAEAEFGMDGAADALVWAVGIGVLGGLHLWEEAGLSFVRAEPSASISSDAETPPPENSQERFEPSNFDEEGDDDEEQQQQQEEEEEEESTAKKDDGDYEEEATEKQSGGDKEQQSSSSVDVARAAAAVWLGVVRWLSGLDGVVVEVEALDGSAAAATHVLSRTIGMDLGEDSVGAWGDSREGGVEEETSKRVEELLDDARRKKMGDVVEEMSRSIEGGGGVFLVEEEHRERDPTERTQTLLDELGVGIWKEGGGGGGDWNRPLRPALPSVQVVEELTSSDPASLAAAVDVLGGLFGSGPIGNTLVARGRDDVLSACTRAVSQGVVSSERLSIRVSEASNNDENEDEDEDEDEDEADDRRESAGKEEEEEVEKLVDAVVDGTDAALVAIKLVETQVFGRLAALSAKSHACARLIRLLDPEAIDSKKHTTSPSSHPKPHHHTARRKKHHSTKKQEQPSLLQSPPLSGPEVDVLKSCLIAVRSAIVQATSAIQAASQTLAIVANAPERMTSSSRSAEASALRLFLSIDAVAAAATRLTAASSMLASAASVPSSTTVAASQTLADVILRGALPALVRVPHPTFLPKRWALFAADAAMAATDVARTLLTQATTKQAIAHLSKTSKKSHASLAKDAQHARRIAASALAILQAAAQANLVA